jgi:Ku70/Ku80 beta-barrel domain
LAVSFVAGSPTTTLGKLRLRFWSRSLLELRFGYHPNVPRPTLTHIAASAIRRVRTEPKNADQMSEPTMLVRLESGFCCVWSILNGPPRQLERLFAPFARYLSCRLVPGHFRFRKDQLQPDQSKTGHRIKYAKVDADTGEEVSNDDIMKGYKVDTDTYIEVSKDELENIALESNRTIDIDEFVPKSDIAPAISSDRTTWSLTVRSDTMRLPSSAKPSAAWIWLLSVASF